jgi:hypothetical protein
MPFHKQSPTHQADSRVVLSTNVYTYHHTAHERVLHLARDAQTFTEYAAPGHKTSLP